MLNEVAAPVAVFKQFHELESLDLSCRCSREDVGSNYIITNPLILRQLASEIVELMPDRFSGIRDLFVSQIFKIWNYDSGELFRSDASVSVADADHSKLFYHR